MSATESDTARSALVGDPRRQAVAALGGYDYQIWRSVEAWLRLTDGETLFLECAEDYDVVSDASAQAVQIKNSADDVSLGSSDVRKAIVEFWKLRDRNPGRQPSLRFLTRGGIRFEQSRPFGDEKGIAVWRKAASGDDAAAAAVGQYLSSFVTLPSLKSFIEQATPEEIRTQLIAPIEWVTEEENLDAVRLAVNRMAIQMGRLTGISAHLSISAVDGLLARCWETACQPTAELRSLTGEDRQLVFESKTSLVIPAASALLTQMGDALLAQNFHDSSRGRFRFAPMSLDLGPPPLPDFSLDRPAVISAVLSALSTKRAVLIAGSEGRGKTTIANLCARRIQQPIRWIDFSGAEDESVRPILETLLVHLRSDTDKQVIVLDDLPVAEGLTDATWTRLKFIIEECHSRHHELIITAKGVHPDAVDPRVRLAKVELLEVPDLSTDEICTFFQSLGCPSDESTKQWAKCTLLQNGGGHPKLVYLRGLELREEGWPPATIESWVTPPQSVDEARTFARQTVARTLQAETRELLYSMSLTTLPFSRDVALKVGSKIPGLSAPGDALDRLIGRWVESQGAKRYRVTPLLTGQAKLAWPEEKIADAHGHLFDAFSQRQFVQVNEAFQILMHAWQSKDSARLGNMLTSLIAEDGDAKNAVYEDLTPLLLIGLGGTNAVPLSPTCSILLRTLQFKVAQQEKPELLEEIACRWAEEIKRVPYGRSRDASELIRAFVVASATGGNLSAATVIRAIEDLARHESLVPELTTGMSKFSTALDQPDLGNDLVPILFGFMYTRCETTEYQEAILTALSTCEPHARDRMLQVFRIPFFTENYLLLDRAWIAESKL